MIGPYLSAEVIDGVFFDARAMWGRSDNDMRMTIGGVGYSGNFNTERWLVSSRLTGKMTYGNWHVTPEARVSYMEEDRKSFTVTDQFGVTSTVIDSRTLSIGQLSAGPEIGYRMWTDDGMAIIEPSVALRVNWDFSVKGDDGASGQKLYDDGPRGEVELGLLYRSKDGPAAKFGFSYDGIGAADFEAWSGYMWVTLPF
jgi:outer membrane autotransporter protein